MIEKHFHLASTSTTIDTMDASESDGSSQAEEFTTSGNLTLATGTRHHRLLNSNEAPLDSDIGMIKSTGLKIDARVLDIDEEIARSFASAQNTAALSPLRRIPPEVLAEIFTWTLPPVYALASARKRFCSNDSPWLLTHISRHWRAVAIAIPSLWSMVAINYHPGMDPAGLYPMSMLETQLSRAQKPKIHFFGHEKSNPGPQIEIFKYLGLHSSRWEELSIILTSALVPILSDIQHRLPLLRRLSIEWSDETSQSDVDLIDCFERAPSLVDATVVNYSHFVPLLLPVHQLTRHDLNGPWDVHQSALVLGANLVEVRICLEFDIEPWPHVDEPIHLPCLRRLYTSHVEILGYLSTPALDELALCMGEGDMIQSRFGPFVEQSGCSLRRLRLEGRVETAKIAHLLKETPSIVDLAIIFSSASNAEKPAVLAMLTMIPDTPHVAPQLQSISIGCRPSCSLDHMKFTEMLYSRWKEPRHALGAAAFLSANSQYALEELRENETLKDLKREGLDFWMEYGPVAQKNIGLWTYYPGWD
ncbi:hypothetical protein B0H16DRAFT_1879206 [Mycena metata]|uniref:F-box domain-containing protein n=1 Tax=Mycena metata TaxID=1033252 RepID=A0AAD7K2X3_9AGAR|nr:hypothetical protein B0H16DRAFT_1879206 [Mycena metata]